MQQPAASFYRETLERNLCNHVLDSLYMYVEAVQMDGICVFAICSFHCFHSEITLHTSVMSYSPMLFVPLEPISQGQLCPKTV